jgi:hypothetical protein
VGANRIQVPWGVSSGRPNAESMTTPSRRSHRRLVLHGFPRWLPRFLAVVSHLPSGHGTHVDLEAAPTCGGHASGQVMRAVVRKGLSWQQ